MGRRPLVLLRNKATISAFKYVGLLPRIFIMSKRPLMTSRAPSESCEKCLGWCPSMAVVAV
eukprot:8882719-Pyramimonas_sp.AAC.1